jgi:hypothetical protein
MLILSYIYILSTNESFNENQIIISKLGNKNGNGFFSNFFFTLNHYIYCNENKINFKIDSNNWLFKYKNGWSDYFIDNELSFYNPSTIKYYSVFDVLGEYTFQMYRDYIKKIYIYNNTTINKIINVKHKFNLIDEQYDSIFIRRGDKLSSESDYYHDNIYIQLLLIKNPNCKTIFLQTDDYNSYINLQKYITDNNLMINLYTLCDENNVGTIVHNSQKNRLNNATINNKNNKNYLSSIITKLNNSKSVEDMNNDEIYNHTLEMIIGIDIVIKSNICILDLQSNVSRFIKLSHNNPENVYDILNPDYQTNYNKIITPWNSL